jgi:hypothetical protein
MKELFFASLWGKKITNKELNSIEESVDKLIPLSKTITKNKKDIDAGAKAANSLGIFTSLLKNTIRELFLTSTWSKKITNKDFNIIEESVNKLIPLSKTITKNKKDINAGAKAAKSINELVSSLNKTMKKLFYVSLWTKLFSDKNIISIETTINKILSLSQIIAKNKKDIESGAKAAKPINELVSSLNKAMRKLALTSMFAKVASIGIDSIEKTVDKLIPLSKKLSKNKKDIENSKKSAKNITALVGNLLISSIFLTASAVVGVPAILGAKVISKIIDIIVPAAKKLSRNRKHLGNAVASSLLFVAFTGIMGVASLALTSIAVMGIPALIGSAVVMGVVAMNVFTFKMLSKAKKNIVIGSVMMALMSTSLILYGIALGKITKATENVTWKQVGVIAGTVVVLGLATAAIGIPAVAACVALGSLVMPFMSFGLQIFASTISGVSKAAENIKMKEVLKFAGTMLAFGLPISALGVLSIPIGLGSLVLGTMSSSLYTFVKSLKIISDMGGTPTKALDQVLNSMKVVRNFFIKNSLKISVTKNAKRYKKLIEPLIKSTELLSKLKRIGSVPMKLINQSLNALKVISDYYINNPLKKNVVKQAKRYRDMMKPFSKTIKYFNKLTEMGSVPMKLVQETLNAMKAIGEYYINNPIKKKAIKQAKRYRDMMKPFGKTLNYFDKLTEMGSVPMTLVQQTLNAMKAIGDYYVSNPIKKKAIKQAKRYRDMMKPFGKTLQYFDTLTKMGSVPTKLVYQTLNSMKAIGDYYVTNPIKKSAIKQAKRYRDMMKPFGKTLNFFGKLKEMGSIPTKLVYQTLNAMSSISKYYVDNPLSIDAIIQANMYRRMMKPFGKTIEYFEKLKTFGSIPTKLIYQVLNATQIITDFYLKQNAGISIGSNALSDTMAITNAVSSFGNTVQYLKELKNIPVIPIDALKSSIAAILDISKFYDNVVVSDSIDLKTSITEIAVDKFTTMAKNIQDKFENIKEINSIAVKSISNACKYIVGFYSLKFDLPSDEKINIINHSVNRFTEIAKIIQEKFENSKEINIKGVESIVNVCNSIVDFYAFKFILASEDKINQINHSVNKFTEIAKTVQDNFVDIKEINKKGLKSIINICKSIVNFYGYKFIFASKDKINQINLSINKFTEIAKTVQNSFENIKEINKKGLKSIINTCKSIVNFYGNKFILLSEDKINQITYSVNKFIEIAKTVQDNFVDIKEINKKGLKSIINTCKSIVDFYGHKFILASEDKINQINYSINKFTKIAKTVQDNFVNIKGIDKKGLKSIINTCKSIVDFYGYKFIFASEDKINQITYSVNKFTEIAKTVQNSFENIKEINKKGLKSIINTCKSIVDFYGNKFILLSKDEINQVNQSVNKFTEIAKTVQDNFVDIKEIDKKGLKSIIDAFKSIVGFYGYKFIFASEDKINQINYSVNKFTEITKTVQDNFVNIKGIDKKGLKSIINTCESIVDFYGDKLIFASKDKINQINQSVNKFTEIAKTIQNSFKNIKEINKKGFESIIDTFKSIVDFYGNKLIFASEDKINQINYSVNKFTEILKTVQNNFVDIKEINKKGLKSIIDTCKSIVNFYGDDLNFTSKDKINQINLSVNKFTEIAKTVQNTFANVKEININGFKSIIGICKSIINFYGDSLIFESEDKIKQINYSVNKFTEIAKNIQDNFENTKEINKKGFRSIINTLKSIVNFYGDNLNFASENKIKQINHSVDNFSTITKSIQNTFANVKEININGFKSIIDICKSIVDFYGNSLSLESEEKIKQINNSIDKFSNIAKKVQNDFANVKEININGFKSIIDTCKYIVNFYVNSLSLESEEKIKKINHSINEFSVIAKKVQNDFANIQEINVKSFESIIDTYNNIVNFYSFKPFFASDKKIKQINNGIDSFAKLTKSIKDNIQGFTDNDYLSTTFAIKSMKEIVSFLDKNTLDDRQQRRAKKNVTLLKTMADAMSSLTNFNTLNVSSVGEAFTNALGGVSTVDLGEVQAVTNMFNAFNNINKSQNVINKFTESVKEFTNTCKNLMDAMNYNTDAINNLDTSAISNSHIIEHRGNNIIELGSNNNQNINNGVCITNVDEIARTIAEKINGVLSVDMPDTQVQLLINGTGGNEWTISRY